MNTPSPTPAATNEQPHGAERADQLILVQLQTADSIGEYHDRLQNVMQEVEGDDKAQERVEQAESAMTTISGNGEFDAVKIEQIDARGVNRGLSDDSAINRQELTPENIIEQTDDVGEIPDHEHHKDDGHRGQREVEGVIGTDGRYNDGETLLEGEVEGNQSKKRRGNAAAARPGRPDEKYGEGQRLVAEVGLDNARRYIRKTGEHAGDRIWFQKQVLRRSGMDTDTMQQKLRTEGGFSEPEILEIMNDVRGRSVTSLERTLARAAA